MSRQRGGRAGEFVAAVVDRDRHIVAEARGLDQAVGGEEAVVGHGQQTRDAIERAENLVRVLDELIDPAKPASLGEEGPRPGRASGRRLGRSGVVQ